MRFLVLLAMSMLCMACSQLDRAAKQDELIKLAAPQLIYPPPTN